MNVTAGDSFMRNDSISSVGGLMNDKNEARDNISSTDQVDSPGITLETGMVAANGIATKNGLGDASGITSKYRTGCRPRHNHKNGLCDSPGITSNTVRAVANSTTTISGLGHAPSITATSSHGDSRGITMSLMPNPQKTNQIKKRFVTDPCLPARAVLPRPSNYYL